MNVVTMQIERQVITLLDDVLNLKGRAAAFDRGTVLLGAVPELDSMAVANVLAALEERFGFVVADDEIDGAVFESVATLTSFVQHKLQG